MKGLKSNILTSALVAALIVLSSMSVNAQELAERKYGTVLEQLRQSSLYQSNSPELAAVLDYEAMIRNSCLWKDGLVGREIEEEEDEVVGMIADLLEYAFTFQGTRYRIGGNGPNAFDCSGFTSYVFKKFGYDLDRTSRGQIADGERVEKDELQPGDLVFFNGRAVNKRIGHVGIVTEVDSAGTGFSFIHASSTRGVRVSKFPDESYYRIRYMGACRPITR